MLRDTYTGVAMYFLSMIRFVAALFVGVCFLTSSPNAFANDSTFGGAGGTLAPLKETRIRMASEHITLEARASDIWTVQAEYVFENLTSESVTVQMGFELGCMGTAIWNIRLP